ncbi:MULTISPECIES: polysaccharide deacetylase family protein [Limnospira]|uniref:polysaccharide deacetylase family protein n=1 Tax=Limnospira TaxID=2596745 RepID=UPI00028040CC|nr:polysaccharide deacetylase [Arthrospira platensis C1]MDY7053651.1 polysaccharide deacetylase family protein [Limnospira fusiformis LS22]RAQ40061.1 polysaccharide deacetylase family protein [Arthrospira sp. O9.13F]UWU48261.1 Peptidoglycan/xylan/chitin deacetylase, PgdA/CDA1 family [Arthrospira platensis C1]
MAKSPIKLQLAFLYPLLYPLLKFGFPNCLWSGNLSQRQIALTIDDGPHPQYTLELLQVLDYCQIKASFFWLGIFVEKYPKIAQEVHRRGHWIGIHGYQHKSFTRLNKRELKLSLDRTQSAICQICGLPENQVIYVRPPNGLFTGKTLQLLNNWNYRTVMWSVVPEDWVEPGVEVVSDRILRQTKNGSIIVLHDGYFGGCHVAETSAKVIPKLLKQGYEFVTIDQLWMGRKNDTLFPVSNKMRSPN